MIRKSLFISLFTFMSIQANAVSVNVDGSSDIGLTAVKVGYILPALQTNLYGPAGPDINYQPAPQSSYGVGLNFGPVVLFLGASATNPDVTKYGETQVSGAGFRYFGSVHSFDIKYETYKGYFINNSEAVTPGWTSSNRIQRPDIMKSEISFKYLYNFYPENFSTGIFDQAVVQTQSGGSAFFGIEAAQRNLSGDTAIVPTSQTANYRRLGTLKSAKLTSLELGFGAGYALVFEGLYLGVYGIAWTGPQSQALDFGPNDSETSSATSIGYDAKASIGYNAEHFFTAINYMREWSQQDISSGKLTFIDDEASVWFGWRF